MQFCALRVKSANPESPFTAPRLALYHLSGGLQVQPAPVGRRQARRAAMENREVARILRETAQLLEIDGAIIGRYRTYEKAAELIAGIPESVAQMAAEPDKLKELPGIGDRMGEHIQEILKTGDYALRKKLLKKYPATILEVLNL